MSDDGDPPRSHPLVRAYRAWAVVRRFAIVLSLAVAMYQLVLIDRQLIGFAIFWLVPPVLVTALDLWVPMGRFAKTVVLIYLFLVGSGTWLSVHPAVLPGLGALHHGGTPFAERWNQLGEPSRRLIWWNMSLAGGMLWWWMGYAIGWMALTGHRRGGRAVNIGKPVAVLVLLVTWGLPLMTLPVFVWMALGR